MKVLLLILSTLCIGAWALTAHEAHVVQLKCVRECGKVQSNRIACMEQCKARLAPEFAVGAAKHAAPHYKIHKPAYHAPVQQNHPAVHKPAHVPPARHVSQVSPLIKVAQNKPKLVQNHRAPVVKGRFMRRFLK